MFEHDNIVYMAGIIDGEGSICIEIQHPGKGKKQNYYNVRLVVCNTNKELIDWLFEKFEGNIGECKKYEQRKQCYHWTLCSQNAKDLLIECLPYMIVKKEQAKLLIDFMETKKDGQYYLTDEISKKREDLYFQMKKLNKTFNR